MSTYNCRGAINGIIVQNNPVNRIDPLGLQEFFFFGDLPPAPIEITDLIGRAADVETAFSAAQDALDGCPTEPWLDKKLNDIAMSDMLSGDNSQVPATTTKPESTIGDYANDMDAWAGHE